MKLKVNTELLRTAESDAISNAKNIVEHTQPEEIPNAVASAIFKELHRITDRYGDGDVVNLDDLREVSGKLISIGMMLFIEVIEDEE